MRILMQLTGTTPLAMHNIRLADKRDPIVMEIAALTKKRTNRTEADDREIERLEFLGGLYYDPTVGVYVPSWAVLRCFENAAKITRQGATVIRGVALTSDKAALDYGGVQSPECLWEQPEHQWRCSVGIQGKKVMRMRPVFRRWGLLFEAELLEEVLDHTALLDIAGLAGRSVGLLDGRKLGYGRFTVEVA